MLRLHRVKTTLFRCLNSAKAERLLEIGCGNERIPGFETLDVICGKNVDYTVDATKRLPFASATFDIIYASHVLEHAAWYQTDDVLREWVRVLKPRGRLEVWVPDGLKICKALVDYETRGDDYIDRDGWYRYNPEREPCKWASGRLFTYGDGTGRWDDANWHRALFTPRFLRLALERAGLANIRELDRSEVRGYDHKWINLGMTGTKP